MYPVTQIIPQRERADCAICAMAMYSGHSYEDVLREVVLVDPRWHGRKGLSDHQVRKVMRTLGVPVRYRSRVDLDEDYGMLRFSDHLALIRNGLLIDGLTLWEIEDWRRHRGYDKPDAVCGIFVAAEA